MGRRGVEAMAKEANGRSRMCSGCEFGIACPENVFKVCTRSFVEGYQKGYRKGFNRVLTTKKDNLPIIKKELYKLLYEWFVCEWSCDDCQHIATFHDADGRHPCNRCENFNRFKLSDNIDADLKEKVNSIIEVIKKK